MEPILCSQAEAGKMLAIGKTKLTELIAEGAIDTVKIGARRLVKISSLKRLAGMGATLVCGADASRPTGGV